MATLKQKPDDSGCMHSMFDGPTRKDGKFEYGLCADCNNQVAIGLDGAGKRTGESWLIKVSG